MLTTLSVVLSPGEQVTMPGQLDPQVPGKTAEDREQATVEPRP